MKLLGIDFKNGALLLFLLGIFGLIGVLAVDKFHFAFYAFQEGVPDFSSAWLTRSFFIFLFCLLLLIGLGNLRKPTFTIDMPQHYFLPLPAIVLALFLSLLFILIFVVSPSTFGQSALEDGPVEWASADFLFAACLVMMYVFVRELKNKDMHWFIKLSLLALAGVFFVMGMEEVSWFQRVFHIETPAEFKGNIQDEMNLHNFATNYVENAYYFGSFVYLVVFPFIRLIYREVEKVAYFKIFVARPFIALIGATACAYNYDMWNIVFMQITFYGAVVIVAYYALMSANGIDKLLSWTALVLLLVPQWIYLTHGADFLRTWDVTEYREMLMPLAFFIYTVDLAIQCKRHYRQASDVA